MSSWVAHVKSVQAKEGISYKAAMTKAKESYKKPEKVEKKESKAQESGEAKMPGKRKSKKDEPKNDMPEAMSKGEKKDKLVVKYESGKRVSSAEAKGKKKKGMLM